MPGQSAPRPGNSRKFPCLANSSFALRLHGGRGLVAHLKG